MNLVSVRRTLFFATLSAALVSGTSVLADDFQVSYLAPGVQSQTSTPSATYYTETFDSGLSSGTTDFGGSGVTGTYTGDYTINGADSYGGAGGTGNYIATIDSSFTLSLSSGVNYFGFWLSAQDAGDTVQFFSNGTPVYTFTPAQLDASLGDCSVSSGPYCGNPNSSGDDTGEAFVFVNFYDATGTFNSIQFSDNIPAYGYESDNHTIALLGGAPGGTVLNPTPEPSSLMLMGTGVVGFAGMMRRRLKK